MSSYVCTDISCLPNELLEYILSYTSPYRDFKSTLQVCKRWYAVTKEVIRCYQQQFGKAIAGGNGVELMWSSHQPEAGPTVTERYSHSACYCNKSVYVFGGCTSTSTTFNDLWRFDLELGRWIRPLATGTYPSPKACASLVAYNGSLILFGGWSHPTPYTFHQASKFFNQLNIYSPETNKWTHFVTVNSPDGIAGHGASIVDDTMVVFGGYHGHGSSSNAVWILDLIQMVWTKKSTSEPKPLPRYSHTQVSLDNRHILILGGCGGPNTQFNDAWLLDMSTEPWTWSELTVCRPDLAAQQLWCHPACQVGDKLVVLGKNNAKFSKEGAAFTCPAVQPRSARAPRVSRAVASVPVPAPVPVPTSLMPVASSSVNSGVVAPAASSSSKSPDAVNLSSVKENQPSDGSTQAHTSGARAGMPSVRPNAMNDRRRRLEALNRYEDLFRARQLATSAQNQPQFSLKTYSERLSVSPGMSVYVLDLSEAVAAGRVTWLPVKGADLSDAPDEAIFYSLVEGRGELMMFGGIRGDARSLQRGNTSTQQHTVLNTVHFLSFCGSSMR